MATPTDLVSSTKGRRKYPIIVALKNERVSKKL